LLSYLLPVRIVRWSLEDASRRLKNLDIKAFDDFSAAKPRSAVSGAILMLICGVLPFLLD
jgi:hypothetical protein